MKRLIRCAVCLYPKRWRRRYGLEFRALLEDVKPDLRTTLDVAKGALKMQMTSWGSGGIVAVGGMLGALLAFGVSFAIPIKYQSQAVINITSVAPPPMVRAEIDREIADRMNMMSQRILSVSDLTAIINNFGLYAAERRRMTMEHVIALMRRNVQIQSVASSVSGRLEGLVVRFSYEDRYQAQRVVDDLLSRYIIRNIRPPRSKWPTQLELLAPATLPTNPVSPKPSRITAMGLTLGLVIGAVYAYVRRIRLPASTGTLEKNHGGTPVFRGTEVPFQTLVEYLQIGRTLDQFLRNFPAVTKEAAVCALETANSLLARQLG